MRNHSERDRNTATATPNVMFTVDRGGVCVAPEPHERPLRAPPAQEPVPVGDEGSHPDDDGPGNDGRDDLPPPPNS